MGILDNFEKGLERAVNGAFAKTFRSGLQPVEIGAALKRELDTKAAIVSRDRILVPNSFVVNMASSDFTRMVALGPTLIDDLVQIVQKHAAAQSFQFAGAVEIALAEAPKMSGGLVEVESSTTQQEVVWAPVLDVAGKRHPITQERTVVGRGHDADITVEDTGISRKHVEIRWDGTTAEAIDLGSTNGSQLNGQPFRRAIIEPDSVIQIGRTRVVFRVLAQTPQPAARPAAHDDAPAPSKAPASSKAPTPSKAPAKAPRQAERAAPIQPAPAPAPTQEPRRQAPDAPAPPPANPEPFRWNL